MIRSIDINHVAANPLYQVLVIFAVAVIFALVDKLAGVVGVYDYSNDSAWIVMASFVLFFALCTSLLSLRTSNMNRYWSRSIISYVCLIAASIGVAYLISGVSMDDAGSFRKIFVALTVGYLTILSIVRLMRRIVDLAIKQDERLRGGGMN